ncbi:hypothetical protein FBU59_004372, partial [Linderina macrospora]
MASETPYSTPELEVSELPPMDQPVHNALSLQCSPPPEAPLPIVPDEAVTAAASLKPAEQSPPIPAAPVTEHQQQSVATAASPLMDRKSTLLKTAPRVPSTLRKVVDVRSVETLNSRLQETTPEGNAAEDSVPPEGSSSPRRASSNAEHVAGANDINQQQPPNSVASMSPVLT